MTSAAWRVQCSNPHRELTPSSPAHRSWPTSCVLVPQVDALRLMHQRASVLHLDLKPDNICISRPAVPDPAVPACATLIDFTTCMPVRDYKGERQPVSTLGVTSFSSLRMEAEPGERCSRTEAVVGLVARERTVLLPPSVLSFASRAVSPAA